MFVWILLWKVYGVLKQVEKIVYKYGFPKVHIPVTPLIYFLEILVTPVLGPV